VILSGEFVIAREEWQGRSRFTRGSGLPFKSLMVIYAMLKLSLILSLMLLDNKMLHHACSMISGHRTPRNRPVTTL
jgi:hypothetical protein